MAPIKIRGLQKLGSLRSRREERGLGREREGHWRFWNGDWCARFTSPLRSRVFFSEGTRSLKCHCHFKVRKETKTRQFYTRRMQLRKAGKTEWSSQLIFLLQTRNTEILNTVRFLKIFWTNCFLPGLSVTQMAVFIRFPDRPRIHLRSRRGYYMETKLKADPNMSDVMTHASLEIWELIEMKRFRRDEQQS